MHRPPPKHLPAARTLLVAALLLTACGAEIPRISPGPETSVDSGLTVAQNAPLSRTRHDVGGFLELRVDSQLTEDEIDRLWETGEAPEGLSPAVLQVVDVSGRVQDRLVLDRQLARFEREQPTLAGSSLWLLTVDYSAPAGSYNGPITFPLTVRDARIHMIDAVDEQGKSAPVRLMRSLKSDWRLEPAQRGGGQEILYVSTSPDFNKPGDFLVTYERLSLKEGRWLRHTRQEPGFWESDGEFPERQSFP